MTTKELRRQIEATKQCLRSEHDPDRREWMINELVTLVREQTKVRAVKMATKRAIKPIKTRRVR